MNQRDNSDQQQSSEQLEQAEQDQLQQPSTGQVIASVLAAAFGVQSSKNRNRDFRQGKAVVYIVTGIIFTLLFIASVFLVVQLVLKNAGMA